MTFRTPYGPVVNFGTDEEPNLGGPAQAVGYVRGVLDAAAAIEAARSLADQSQAVEIIKALL